MTNFSHLHRLNRITSHKLTFVDCLVASRMTSHKLIIVQEFLTTLINKNNDHSYQYICAHWGNTEKIVSMKRSTKSYSPVLEAMNYQDRKKQKKNTKTEAARKLYISSEMKYLDSNNTG